MIQVYSGGKYDEPAPPPISAWPLQLSQVYAAYRRILKLDQHAIEMVLWNTFCSPPVALIDLFHYFSDSGFFHFHL